jgi:hypothetical protein
MTTYTNATKSGNSNRMTSCGAGAVRRAVVHSVPASVSGGDWFDKALCGVRPGLRSYGWIGSAQAVNCAKCLRQSKAESNS